jgi:hypothetical protein
MSLPGGNQSPYRLPCTGTVLCGNGPRFQNARADENNIAVFIYDAQVPNWDTEVGGNIPPYERYADNSGGTCESNDCVGGAAPCDPWIGAPGSIYYNLMDPPPTPVYYQPYVLTEAVIVSGGSGYHVGDLLGLTGGTTSSYIPPLGISYNVSAQLMVTAVDGSGAITAVAITSPGSYQTLPGSPNVLTEGSGSGATCDITFQLQTENISTCQKIGFKNVQAKRQWHGQPGFFWGGSEVLDYCCTDNANVTFYWGESLDAPQTKYTTLEWDCKVHADSSGGFPSFDDEFSGSVSVDPNSGVLTVNSYVPGDTSSPDSAQEWFAGSVSGGYGYNVFGDAYDWASYISFPYGTGIDGGTLSCTDSGITDNAGEGQPPWAYSEWSSSAGSFTGTQYALYNYVGDEAYDMYQTVTISDSSMTFELMFNMGVQNEDGSWPYHTTTITVTLSGSNTADDLLSDINTLLDEWDLTDDAVYPWRNDAYTSTAPLVMRNEYPGNIAPSAAYGFDTSYVDPSSYIYDGSIIGSPLAAGFQQYFDFYYTDWQNCFNGSETVGYILGWGHLNNLYNFGVDVPRTATHWTTNDIAWQMTGGAWIFYNCNTAWSSCVTGGSGTWPAGAQLIAQKWAETKVPFPSQNFFRPAADDRFAYDESNVYTIASITGSGMGAEIYLLDSAECSVESSLSPTGLWGGQSVGGFYEVTGNGNPFTLGTLVYNVPSDWSTESGDAAIAFGKLRWSTGDVSTDPPAILGRAGVTSVAEYEGSPSVTEITTGAIPTLGMNPSSADSVDIYDASMTHLAGNVPVTRIDDSHFTVNVDLSTIQNAAWIQSYGSPAYYWNDAYPKGDYVYTDWTYWPRLICEPQRINQIVADCSSDDTCDCPSGGLTIYCFPFFNPVLDEADDFTHAFTQEAACLPFQPCNPSVLCISPNGESFENGTTYDFPTIYLDEQNGSGWYAEFQQVMVDVLYEGAHWPAQDLIGVDTTCVPATFQWLEDDGSCQVDTDTVSYFAHGPLVEARLTLPDNGGSSHDEDAPGLPSGISLGWSSPAGLTTDCESPASDVLFPPGPNGYGLQGPLPIWFIWAAECNCIQSAGTFADVYENQVAGCS